MAGLAGSNKPSESSPLQFPIILDTGVYTIAGSTWTLSGLALIVTAVFNRHMMANWRHPTTDLADVLLVVSGLAIAISGSCMPALAAEIPQSAGVLGGTGTEITLLRDVNNMNSERMAADID